MLHGYCWHCAQLSFNETTKEEPRANSADSVESMSSFGNDHSCGQQGSDLRLRKN